MTTKLRMFGVWSAIAFFSLWLVGFLFFAQWVPPVAPSANAAEVANLFGARSVPILIGMVLMSLGAIFYLPWTMVLADLIKEREGNSMFLSGTMLGAGVVSCMMFILPSYLWAAAAFRPERSPEITQALVDLGWLLFITTIAPFILQYMILAVVTFTDERPVPIYPRWSGYLQLWVSVSFLPAVIAFFLKTGPFAWNGLLVWWIPFATFTAWFFIMIALTRKAVLRRDATSAPSDVELTNEGSLHQ